MKPLNNWDTTRAATGEVERIAPGGYICNIRGARVETTSTRNGEAERIAISLEICEGPYAGFFQKRFDEMRSSSSDPRWPCVFTQFLLDRDGNASPHFKGTIQAIVESNPGYTWNWDEKTLNGKRVGVIFGEEEFMGRDGQVHTTVHPRWFRSADKVRAGDYKVPEKRGLRQEQAAAVTAGLRDITGTGEDDGLPF